MPGECGKPFAQQFAKGSRLGTVRTRVIGATPEAARRPNRSWPCSKGTTSQGKALLVIANVYTFV